MATLPWIAIGAAIRLFLIFSSLSNLIANSVEVSTPINSWKRVTEGVYLYQHGIDPYSGSLFHETPIALFIFKILIESWTTWIPFLFVICDILTACLMSRAAKHFARDMLIRQSYEVKSYASDVTSILIRTTDLQAIPTYVMIIYLLNPYSIANCVGMTTTVFSNLILSLTLYFAVKGDRIGACISLAVATYQSFYPVMLIVPVCMCIAEKEVNHKGVSYFDSSTWNSISSTLAAYITIVGLLLYGSAEIVGSWTFMNAIYGSILTVPDLTPNIGLFWYFFTEMFSHFRTFFICTFQINVFIYLIPLTIRLRREPVLLFFILCCVMTVFKSYPSIGDVAFYIALLPLWLHLYRYMRQSFFIGGFFMSCTVLGPIMRYLWLYSGSGNSNFYFAITLAFATGQIFLLTDILFAYIKREYHLHNGLKIEVNNKPGKLSLK